MARASIQVSDHGYKRLLEKIGEARGQTLIRAGVFDGPPRNPERGASSAPQPTNAEVAAINEFGLGHNPERSFLRATVDQEKSEIHDRLRHIGGTIFDFKSTGDIKQEARLFGEWFVGRMKQRIRDGIDPPDAPATIAEKGSSTPLIDSGQFWSSLTYDVTQGGR